MPARIEGSAVCVAAAICIERSEAGVSGVTGRSARACFRSLANSARWRAGSCGQSVRMNDAMRERTLRSPPLPAGACARTRASSVEAWAALE